MLLVSHRLSIEIGVLLLDPLAQADVGGFDQADLYQGAGGGSGPAVAAAWANSALPAGGIGVAEFSAFPAASSPPAGSL